jgi:hypothetical protein
MAPGFMDSTGLLVDMEHDGEISECAFKFASRREVPVGRFTWSRTA